MNGKVALFSLRFRPIGDCLTEQLSIKQMFASDRQLGTAVRAPHHRPFPLPLRRSRGMPMRKAASTSTNVSSHSFSMLTKRECVEKSFFCFVFRMFIAPQNFQSSIHLGCTYRYCFSICSYRKNIHLFARFLTRVSTVTCSSWGPIWKRYFGPLSAIHFRD